MGEPAVSDFLRGVLDLAPKFSREGSNNVHMEEREEFLRGLESKLEDLLSDEKLDSQFLFVERGGRQYMYSPVPWVRIFDPEHAPTAQNGFYVVLLFAADGSAVFLSLNQGTSEFRSNKMRPILNDDVLLNRAAMARMALDTWASDVAVTGSIAIDLRGNEIPVRAESKRRVRNYELANIFAYKYSQDKLPSDTTFMSHLEELLVLLWALESEDLTAKTKFLFAGSAAGAGISKKGLTSRQGRQINEKVKKLVELTAEDRAEEYYLSVGWKVERVGSLKLGYDLRCTMGELELHVEVKGTSGRGLEVTLTPNEVAHCRHYPKMALVVVSEIEVDEDETIRDSGKLLVIDPWILDDSCLTPSEYAYRVQRLSE